MGSVDVRANEVTRQQYGCGSRTQLTAAGVSARTIHRRVARGVWSEPLPGVIDLGTHPASWHQRAMMALLAAGRGAVLSHHTAAYLHGFLDVHRPRHVDVLVPRGARTRAPGARLHTTLVLGEDDVGVVAPFRVTSPARTLLDVAGDVPDERSELLLWELCRRRRTAVEELADLLVRHPRARGARGLRSLLRDVPEGVGRAESPLEVVGLYALRRAGMPKPVVQHVIRDERGRFVARVDAAWPAARAVVEFDGAAYHDPPTRRRRDAERHDRLRRLGWRVHVLRAADLRDPARLRAVARDLRVTTG